jgi:hypothetical protein
MNYFKDTFGFKESGYAETRKRFQFDPATTVLKSSANDREFHVGKFEVLSLAELKARLSETARDENYENLGQLKFSVVCGSVNTIHKKSESSGSVFQAASQFNCLEMVGPGVTPEHGITQYAIDRTQGPACALACSAGTVYRNYFATNGSNGQINCLSDVEALLTEPKKKYFPYWTVKNGYCLPNTHESMASLNVKLGQDESLVKALREMIKVGIHWSTEVTKTTTKKTSNDYNPHRVCQIFVSACPVAYTKSTKSTDWRPFASLVLDSVYESTLAASALLAVQRNERVRVYLTSVGGGAFGNRTQWISSAVLRALSLFMDFPLDVYMVNYNQTVSQQNKELVRNWGEVCNKKRGGKKLVVS